jgi:hypothetical protein
MLRDLAERQKHETRQHFCSGRNSVFFLPITRAQTFGNSLSAVDHEKVIICLRRYPALKLL